MLQKPLTIALAACCATVMISGCAAGSKQSLTLPTHAHDGKWNLAAAPLEITEIEKSGDMLCPVADGDTLIVFPELPDGKVPQTNETGDGFVLINGDEVRAGQTIVSASPVELKDIKCGEKTWQKALIVSPDTTVSEDTAD